MIILSFCLAVMQMIMFQLVVQSHLFCIGLVNCMVRVVVLMHEGFRSLLMSFLTIALKRRQKI